MRPRTKHIALKYHHFRSHVGKKISIQKVAGDNQSADILTKPLADALFSKHRKTISGWWKWFEFSAAEQNQVTQCYSCLPLSLSLFLSSLFFSLLFLSLFSPSIIFVVIFLLVILIIILVVVLVVVFLIISLQFLPDAIGENFLVALTVGWFTTARFSVVPKPKNGCFWKRTRVFPKWGWEEGETSSSSDPQPQPRVGNRSGDSFEDVCYFL